jgi:hypothetical protein
MAYRRPVEFCRIAADLEALASRSIEISIDGPLDFTDPENKSVVDFALSWKSWSKHDIRVWVADKNLGLFDHFSLALDRFFNHYQLGLVLEDDLEFRPEFIEFLDSSYARELLEKYFSICGNNPLSDLSEVSISQSINLQETNIHTISGWAASADSVKFFLGFMKKYRFDSPYLASVAKSFSRRLTKDPFLSIALSNNWSGKIQRAIGSPKPNWDNYWELAAWSSRKASVRPSISLTRESPIVFGKQTHSHDFEFKLWPRTSDILNLDLSTLLPLRKTLEVKALRIWGTWRLRAYKEFLLKILSKFRRGMMN